MARRLRLIGSRRIELAVYLLLLLVIGLYTRGAVKASDHRQTVRNCVAIELLKVRIRPEVFNLADVKTTLRQLGIDPKSPNGVLLIQRARKSTTSGRARFAPSSCPK